MESTATTSSTANSVPPFLGKLYDLVEDSSTNDVVSWSDDNNSFVVWKVAELSRDLLPKYFKHSNFSSFVRQLNTYGFRKVDPDHYEFANEGFLRGQKHLLKGISRRKSAQVHGQQQPRLQSSARACVEVGKFGLEEEVEILKRDKNILMQELIRVRQQQQTTENQLQTVGQRVQVMEQRQQQLMSFLAKAMNSPGFLSQLVQPQNESNSRISGGNKKRRLPRQDEENMNGSQIIKFQPFMHETAKAMLQKLSKINGSSGVDQSKNNGSQFMVDNVSSSNALDNGSSTSQISGVTFSEIPPVSGQSCASTDYPVSCASTAISGMTVNNSKAGSVSHDVIEPQGTTPVGNPGPNDIMSETEKSLLDASLFCPDVDMDMDILADGISKSPADEDAFWEQFLAANPLTEDTDEINPNFLEDGLTNEQPLLPVNENGWSKSQHLDNLTEQMGLLVSEKRRP